MYVFFVFDLSFASTLN